MIEIVRENEDSCKDLYFGGITFRLNNNEDIEKAKKIIKDIFDEDKLSFGIEGGYFSTKKTSKSILLKYYGNIGSTFYKMYFKDLIKKMKSAGIEIKYQPIPYSDRYKVGGGDFIYSLDNEKDIENHLNSNSNKKT